MSMNLVIVLGAVGLGVVIGMFVGVGAVALDRRRLMRTLIARATREDLRVIEHLVDERRELQESAATRQLT
jgi:hypothetical protein